MSPGSVTERLHFFAAPYTPADRTGPGGGLEEEGEDIEVLEVPFAEALAMTRDGRIADGKTILLLQWAALDGPFAPGRAPPDEPVAPLSSAPAVPDTLTTDGTPYGCPLNNSCRERGAVP